MTLNLRHNSLNNWVTAGSRRLSRPHLVSPVPLPMVVPGLLPPMPLGAQSSLSSRPANTTTTSMKVGSTDRNLWKSSWEIDINVHRPSKSKLIAIVKNLLLQPCLSLVVMVSLANGSTVQVNKHLIIDTMLREMKMTYGIDVFWSFQDNSCSRSTLSTSDPSATAPLVTPVWVIHNSAQYAVYTVR